MYVNSTPDLRGKSFKVKGKTTRQTSNNYSLSQNGMQYNFSKEYSNLGVYTKKLEITSHSHVVEISQLRISLSTFSLIFSPHSLPHSLFFFLDGFLSFSLAYL